MSIVTRGWSNGAPFSKITHVGVTCPPRPGGQEDRRDQIMKAARLLLELDPEERTKAIGVCSVLAEESA